MPHQFLCLCCERYFDTERGLTCHRRRSQFCRGQGTKRKFGTLSENAVPDSTHDTLISEGQEYLLPEADAQSSTSAAPEDGSFYSNLSDSSSSAETEDSEAKASASEARDQFLGKKPADIESGKGIGDAERQEEAAR